MNTSAHLLNQSMPARNNDVDKFSNMITVYRENKQETKIFSTEAFHGFYVDYITKYDYLLIHFYKSQNHYILKNVPNRKLVAYFSMFI